MYYWISGVASGIAACKIHEGDDLSSAYAVFLALFFFGLGRISSR